MKYPCKMIRDLMPLYHDSVCSEESAAAIEEHFRECESCAEAYRALLESDRVLAGEGGEAPVKEGPGAERDPRLDPMGKFLKKTRWSVKWRTALICVLLTVLLAALGTGIGFWLNMTSVPLPADLIETAEYTEREVDEDEGIFPDGISREIVFTLRDRYRDQYPIDEYGGLTFSRVWCDVDGDGREEEVMICCFPISRWNCLLSRIQRLTGRTPDRGREKLVFRVPVDVAGPEKLADRVYFFPDREDFSEILRYPAELSHFPEGEAEYFPKVTEEDRKGESERKRLLLERGVLLWER